ncbi:hypothetical protein D3C75_813750 [compost metagenome]
MASMPASTERRATPVRQRRLSASTTSSASRAANTPRLPVRMMVPHPAAMPTITSDQRRDGRQNTSNTISIITMSASTIALVNSSARGAPWATCSAESTKVPTSPANAPRHSQRMSGRSAHTHSAIHGMTRKRDRLSTSRRPCSNSTTDTRAITTTASISQLRTLIGCMSIRRACHSRPGTIAVLTSSSSA